MRATHLRGLGLVVAIALAPVGAALTSQLCVERSLLGLAAGDLLEDGVLAEVGEDGGHAVVDLHILDVVAVEGLQRGDGVALAVRARQSALAGETGDEGAQVAQVNLVALHQSRESRARGCAVPAGPATRCR